MGVCVEARRGGGSDAVAALPACGVECIGVQLKGEQSNQERPLEPQGGR